MIAQVDEQQPAMVADAVAPAGQTNLLADVAVAERAAGMGAVTMHGIPGKGSRRVESEANGPRQKSVRVYPRQTGPATEWPGDCRANCQFPAQPYLQSMTVH